MISLHQVAFTA